MQKRKRGGGPFAGEGPRPSPHSPDATDLGRQSREFEQLQRGRGGYGGRGGPARGRGRGGSNHPASRRGSYHQDRHDRDRQHSAPTTPLSRNPPSSPFPKIEQEPKSAMLPPATPTEMPASPKLMAPKLDLHPSTMGQMEDLDSMDLWEVPDERDGDGNPRSKSRILQIATKQRRAEVLNDAEGMCYHYDILTDDLISSDRDELEQIIAHITPSLESQDYFQLMILYEELLMAGIMKKLHPAVAGKHIKAVWQLDESLSRARIEAGTDDDPFGPDQAQLRFLDALTTFTVARFQHPYLRILLRATEVSPQLMRVHLPSELLICLHMVRQAFETMATRHRTKELYIQSKFNLLREETEGYAKLVTELSDLSSISNPTHKQAEQSFARVTSLIGIFSLEPGRVLDIVMDVASSVLVRRYRFFVKFLRASSWWPRQFVDESDPFHQLKSLPTWALHELENATPEEIQAHKDQMVILRHQRDVQFWEMARSEKGIQAFYNLTSSPSGDVDEVRQAWISATGSAPGSGYREAAQFLGKKLRDYSSHPSGEQPDKMLSNLISLAAMLIKVGFISILDLYPHLYPFDSHQDKKDGEREDDRKRRDERNALPLMSDIKLRKEAERAEEQKSRSGGNVQENALSRASALTDDTLPPGARPSTASQTNGETAKDEAMPDADEKPKIEAEDQKIQLLKALLLIGALPEALFIIGKHPWVLDAYPDLRPYLHRIFRHCLSKVTQDLAPLNEITINGVTRSIAIPHQSQAIRGVIKRVDAHPRVVHRWASLEKDDDGKGNQLTFYWDEWADHVPVCQTMEDVFTLCHTLLNLSGVKIGYDVELLVTLARLGVRSLNSDPSEELRTRWAGWCKRLIIPALSLTSANAGVNKEVYQLLSKFDTQIRWTIYAEWFTGKTSLLSDVKAALAVTKFQTRDILKRISKENWKEMARALAKVTYSSPGRAFLVALHLIEDFDNLTTVVIECAQYFTPMGYDVLTWALLTALGGGLPAADLTARERMRLDERSRVQSNGLNTSKWLTSLAQFAGQTFKRYRSTAPRPLVQYVYAQLKKNKTDDLIVLKELITSMGGLISDVNFTDAQVQAMAGGPLIRHQMLASLHDSRHLSKMTGKRLISALIPDGLIADLLVVLCHQAQTAIYNVPDDEADLKVLGNIQDELYETLGQYLELLRTFMSTEEFDGTIPGLIDLIAKYKVEPKLAFWICRDSLSRSVREQLADLYQQATKSRSSKPPLKKTESAAETVTMTKKSPQQSQDASTTQDVTMADTPADTNSASTPDEEAKSADLGYLNTIASQLRDCLPEKTIQILPPSLYFTFWQMELHDLLVPARAYEAEQRRCLDEERAAMNDRTDSSALGRRRREERQQDARDRFKKIGAELEDRLALKSFARERLLLEKDIWFAEYSAKEAGEIADAFIQHCLVPRVLMSPIDAAFAYRFLKTIHEQKTINFRTMVVLDRLFRKNTLASLIFLSTTAETTSLGFFLNEALKDLWQWSASKTAYEKEALGRTYDKNKNPTDKKLVGFALKVSSPTEPEMLLEHPEFCKILKKWHLQLYEALEHCLTSGEYMHVSNAITVIRAVFAHFPRVKSLGHKLLASLDTLKKDAREDVKLSATALYALFVKKDSEWVEDRPDRKNLTSSRAAPRSGARTPRSSTPQPTTRELPAKPATSQRSTPVAPKRDGIPAKPSINDSRTNTPSEPAKASQPTAVTNSAQLGEQERKLQEAKIKLQEAAKQAAARKASASTPTAAPQVNGAKPPVPERNPSRTAGAAAAAQTAPPTRPAQQVPAPPQAPDRAYHHSDYNTLEAGRPERPAGMMEPNRRFTPGTAPQSNGVRQEMSPPQHLGRAPGYHDAQGYSPNQPGRQQGYSQTQSQSQSSHQGQNQGQAYGRAPDDDGRGSNPPQAKPQAQQQSTLNPTAPSYAPTAPRSTRTSARLNGDTNGSSYDRRQEPREDTYGRLNQDPPEYNGTPTGPSVHPSRRVQTQVEYRTGERRDREPVPQSPVGLEGVHPSRLGAVALANPALGTQSPTPAPQPIRGSTQNRDHEQRSSRFAPLAEALKNVPSPRRRSRSRSPRRSERNARERDSLREREREVDRERPPERQLRERDDRREPPERRELRDRHAERDQGRDLRRDRDGDRRERERERDPRRESRDLLERNDREPREPREREQRELREVRGAGERDAHQQDREMRDRERAAAYQGGRGERGERGGRGAEGRYGRRAGPGVGR